ncbi:hypothetical protein AGMMS50239_34330 [Bacteroidia bacterium]|nr:hypothetical protein AGMMS50239_34330 [Bacteroidia bacterium]
MQIKYSSSNSSGQIKKPLIVAEGFDPSYIVGEEFKMDLIKFLEAGTFGVINIPYPGGGATLSDRIDLAQFDIIYLDYNRGTDDIWRNAQLFKDIIKQVNTLKQGSEQNIVMGISMGGLVARIALRQLENEGYNHQTKKYISVDSPYKGANVPVGFQAAVRHIQNTNLQVFFINVIDYRNFKDAKKMEVIPAV